MTRVGPSTKPDLLSVALIPNVTLSKALRPREKSSLESRKRPMLERVPWAMSAALSSNLKYRVATSSGGFCKSPSIRHTYTPRAASTPVRQLAAMPRLRRCRRQRTASPYS